MPPVVAHRKLLVGSIADGDDLARPVHVVDVAGPCPAQVEPGPVGSGHRAGMDGAGGLGSGRSRLAARQVAPEGGGELRPGRVVRADEEDIVGPWASQVRPGQRIVAKPDVSAPAVARGHEPLDQTDTLQGVEMVREEVAGEVVPLSELLGGAVAEREVVNDGQPCGFAESGVDGGSSLEIGAHTPTIITQ